MKDRIKKIRKDAGLNQTEFGEVIGATQFMVTSYETGRAVPDSARTMLICEKFNVNPEWLEHGGDVEPYKASLISQLTTALRNAPAIEAALEQLLGRLSLEDWKALNAVVRKAIQAKEKEE